jgi:uncharacterized protein (TIRG00374 family)
MPVGRRFASHLEEFYDSSYTLLSPRATIEMGLLSTCSWFFEVLGFYFTLIGLGVGHSGTLLLHAAFILPIATIASAISFLPGGLGVAEGSIQALLQTIVKISKSKAAVATLIIRFGTLWFGVIVGLIAFGILNRQLTAKAAQSPSPVLATGETLPEAPP